MVYFMIFEMQLLKIKVSYTIDLIQRFRFFLYLDLSIASLTFWTVKYIWRQLNTFYVIDRDSHKLYSYKK